jgi:L-arabinose transport system substrate-binding protein
VGGRESDHPNRALQSVRRIAIGLCSVFLAGCGKEAATSAGNRELKIGFMVKQPEAPWFQLEWEFAEQAGADKGFKVIKIGAMDGERVLAGIDNLAAAGAKGFIICTPDARLGPAIVARAKATGLKVMSVDDQFIGADGKFMNLPHMGISARDIGREAGKALFAEMQVRGWNSAETGVAALTFEELETARERTDGAIDALLAAGMPAGRIFKAPLKTSDVPGGFDATNVLLTQQAGVKRWLVCGLNDEAVIGAVRAMEGRGFGAAEVIGVGIGGVAGVTEFKKDQATGFFGSILLAPKRHGYETAELMYKWITQDISPPPVTYTNGILITRTNHGQVMKEQGFR